MINVAVIGVGSMGRNHVRVYTELPEARLVGVCDANQAAAENVAGRFGVPAYTDYHQLFAEARPEAVSIATPTALHEEVALAALEAGAHILIEKPIAATIEEGRRIIARAAELNRKLMIGHIVRFNPALQELKKKLDAGELGRIFQILCRRAGPFPARIRDVGVVVDLAPHDVDVMRFLTGLEPIRVFAETEQRIHTDHEDLILGLLRFPDGVTGALEINWLTPTKVREVVVLGEYGMFKVDDLTQDLYFFENAYTDEEIQRTRRAAESGELVQQENLYPALRTLKGVSEGRMTRFALQRYEPLKAELQAFLRSVASDTPPAVSGEDGLAALRLALALVESGLTHQVIEV